MEVRIAELWSWGGLVRDPANSSELHDMRIAAKRLRYCIEFFAPLLGSGAGSVLAKFKQLQDYLGEIHDCDVWAQMLGKMQHRELKRRGRAGELTREADELLGNLATRRSELFWEFLGYWDELGTQGFRAELLAIADKVAQHGCGDGG